MMCGGDPAARVGAGRRSRTAYGCGGGQKLTEEGRAGAVGEYSGGSEPGTSAGGVAPGWRRGGRVARWPTRFSAYLRAVPFLEQYLDQWRRSGKHFQSQRAD